MAILSFVVSMVSVWCVVVGRGAIKSPDTQRAHVIPNSHFGQGRIIGDFKEISSGLTGNLVRKEPTIVISDNMPHCLEFSGSNGFTF